MVEIREFSTEDGEKELMFVKQADFYVKGFSIAAAFDGVETVEEFRAVIAGLAEKVAKDKTEKIYHWILVDEELAGVITLRPALNGFWLHNAGHIGIAIDKPFRRNGNGTEAFRLICEKAEREFGIKDIVTMALTENIASRTMIEKNGGEYWDTIVAADGAELARYWVKRP